MRWVGFVLVWLGVVAAILRFNFRVNRFNSKLDVRKADLTAQLYLFLPDLSASRKQDRRH
jgi:hypothetical protein